jgi:hypothetical protein
LTATFLDPQAALLRKHARITACASSLPEGVKSRRRPARAHRSARRSVAKVSFGTEAGCRESRTSQPSRPQRCDASAPRLDRRRADRQGSRPVPRPPSERARRTKRRTNARRLAVSAGLAPGTLGCWHDLEAIEMTPRRPAAPTRMRNPLPSDSVSSDRARTPTRVRQTRR